MRQLRQALQLQQDDVKRTPQHTRCGVIMRRMITFERDDACVDARVSQLISARNTSGLISVVGQSHP